MKSPGGWMSLQGRMAAVRGGRWQEERLEKSKVGIYVPCNLGERVWILFWVCEIAFIYFACRKPFKVWIFSRNSSQDCIQDSADTRCACLCQSGNLTCFSGPCSHLILPQDPPQSSSLEPFPFLFAFFLFMLLFAFCLVLNS